MLKWYGYVGIALVLLVQLNFFLSVQPFAEWYIPIVWYGYILFVDSLIYKIKSDSLISRHKKEFVFMLLISIPFWSLFEFYNIFTHSWVYYNYEWYVHLFDFSTIMPAILETFMLFRAMKIFSRFDVRKKAIIKHKSIRLRYVRILTFFGGIIVLLPFIYPSIGFPIMWIGLFLLLDPLNYLLKKESLVAKVARGHKSTVIQLFLAGLVMGFFWEGWNYFALPKWVYTLPAYIAPGIRLFEMPLFGYLGYLPFAAEVFLFYVFFRSIIFKNKLNILAIGVD